MTLDDIKAIDREFLTPAQVAEIMGCDAQDIRVTARERPDLLGFPVCIIKSRMKIPRIPFLRFMGVDV